MYRLYTKEYMHQKYGKIFSFTDCSLIITSLTVFGILYSSKKRIQNHHVTELNFAIIKANNMTDRQTPKNTGIRTLQYIRYTWPVQAPDCESFLWINFNVIQVRTINYKPRTGNGTRHLVYSTPAVRVGHQRRRTTHLQHTAVKVSGSHVYGRHEA